jgi:Holliday junction DNA helicase RuvA
MIARLRGQLAEKILPWVIIDVAGVGYSVEVPLSTFEQLGVLGEETILLTEMVVREDALLLYGFATEKERALFRLLVKVNGVGPKLSLGILSSLSVDAFVQAVRDKQVSVLIKIPGVGKKTAERLVLELASLVDVLLDRFVIKNACVTLATSVMIDDQYQRNQIVQALEALGYKQAEAMTRVERSWQDGLSLSDNIKRALQIIL